MPASVDDVTAMVFFARVVEEKSFTAAAARLGVAKSVVSQRISRLEERLGARLLQRTTRRLSVTPEGLTLYERAARITAAADEAAAIAAGTSPEARGLLRVGTSPALAQARLCRPIASFLERFPETRVELVLGDRLTDLVDEGLDVVIRVTARLRDSSLVQRKLANDRTVVCASPAYLARKGSPKVPADLLHHDCLRYSLLEAADEWRFRDPKGSFGVPVEARLSAGSGPVLRAAALAGLGLAVLPGFLVAADLSAGRLVAVLAEHTYIRLGIYALYPAAGVVPKKVMRFVDHLGAALRQGNG
jgi:DNA-binding transcriptional LysR family regulator